MSKCFSLLHLGLFRFVQAYFGYIKVYFRTVKVYFRYLGLSICFWLGLRTLSVPRGEVMVSMCFVLVYFGLFMVIFLFSFIQIYFRSESLNGVYLRTFSVPRGEVMVSMWFVLLHFGLCRCVRI